MSAIAVALALTSAACTGGVNRSADSSGSAAARHGGWTVTVSGAGSATVHAAAAAQAAGDPTPVAAPSPAQPFTRDRDAVQLAFSGGALPASGAQLSRSLPTALPTDVIAAFAFYDEKLHLWKAVPTNLSPDRRTLSAHIAHFSLWDTVYYWMGKVLTERADPPQCAGTPSWLDTTVSLQDRNAPVLWCAGWDPAHHDQLVVKAVNNRAYGIALRTAAAPEWSWTSLRDGSGLSDVLKAGASRLMTLPDQVAGLLDGVVFLPPGSEVDFGFSEAVVRAAKPPLVSASVELSYVVGGLIYEVGKNVAEDGGYGRGALVAFALIDVAQCGHDVTSRLSADRILGALTCAVEHADAARVVFVDVALKAAPSAAPETIARAAARFQEVLMVIAAAKLGAQIGEAISDRRLDRAAWLFNAYPKMKRNPLLPFVHDWGRHGESLTVHADGTGVWSGRTYDEDFNNPSDHGMNMEQATLRLNVAADGKTLLATVLTVTTTYGDGTPRPGGKTYVKPGEVWRYALQPDGALGVLSGPDYYAGYTYCREGVSDPGCGA